LRAKILCNSAENGVVIGRFVMRYCPPIHRPGSGMGFPQARDHIVVPAFRIGVLLVHERDTAETALESSKKVVMRQIAFYTDSFFALAVE